GVARVARAPYRLASSEMQEFSDQLKELSDKGFVRIKSLLNAIGITAAQVYVNTALMNLGLLMNFKKTF
nr:putative reverse transcriptase domain-containing protein [Tanacetum cinerariifolium]